MKNIRFLSENTVSGGKIFNIFERACFRNGAQRSHCLKSCKSLKCVYAGLE